MEAIGSGGGDYLLGSSVPLLRDPVILREQVLLQLKKIIDPDLYQDIVSLGFIKDLQIDYDNSKVSFTLELTTPACPVKEDFVSQAETLLKELGWITDVDITLSSRKAELMPGSSSATENLCRVASVLCVASCKGGVGKSSIAVNLAFTLSRLGASVGLVDADVYGPSLPQLIPMQNPSVTFHSFEAEEAAKKSQQGIGINIKYEESLGQVEGPRNTAASDKKTFVASGRGGLVPLTHKGVKLMSAGYLKSTTEYAAIRGPLASGLAYQLVTNTLWGELDYLIIDMPPGTGDVHLTLAQGLKIDAALMITTPQQLSLADVEKGIHMFNKLNIPTLAVVENMSYFQCPNCLMIHEVFNHNSKPFCLPEVSGKVSASKTEKVDKLNDDSADNQVPSVQQVVVVESYSNMKRLLDQFGIQHHICLPLHNDLARLRFAPPPKSDDPGNVTANNKVEQEVNSDNGEDCGVNESQYIYPFALAFDESHQVWKRLKEMAQLVAREMSTLKFAADCSPDVSTTTDGMLQVVLKSKYVERAFTQLPSRENILLVPLRYVRLSCRCAECMDEFTGSSKLQNRKISLDIYIKSMQKSGNYAVAIDWSDGHHSLLSFSLLEGLCRTYSNRSQKDTSKSVRQTIGCEDSEKFDW